MSSRADPGALLNLLCTHKSTWRTIPFTASIFRPLKTVKQMQCFPRIFFRTNFPPGRKELCIQRTPSVDATTLCIIRHRRTSVKSHRSSTSYRVGVMHIFRLSYYKIEERKGEFTEEWFQEGGIISHPPPNTEGENNVWTNEWMIQ